MEKFRGVDYYAIEGLLSEEERMIRDAVRDWVEAESHAAGEPLLAFGGQRMELCGVQVP